MDQPRVPRPAADPTGGPALTSITNVTRFAGQLTDYVTAIAGSLAVLFIAINGVRWAISNGNPHRQSEARAGLIAAGVGLAITLSANLIAQLVIRALR